MKSLRVLSLIAALAGTMVMVDAASAVQPSLIWHRPAHGSTAPVMIASPQATGTAWRIQSGCAPLTDKIIFQPLTAAGMGAAVTIAPCEKPYTAMSDPALTYNQVTKKLYVIWAQKPPNSKSAYLYTRGSSDGGRSFGKRILLKTLHGEHYPPVLTAAAYAARLWVEWVSMNLSIKHSPLHLEAFDPRTGEVLPAVQGLDRFYVIPARSAMAIYPSKDGVAAFWQDMSGNKITWHVADTERVTDSKSFRVRFVYRGQVGESSRNRIFVGEDGKVYRLAERTDDSNFRDVRTAYTLDHWAFKTNGFAPAYAAEQVASLSRNMFNLDSPTIAAQVDPQHTLTLIYQPNDPATKAKSCSFGTSLQTPYCIVADSGASPAGALAILRVDPDGRSHASTLPLPLAPASAATGGEALAFFSYFYRPENMITSRFGAPRLFAASAYGPVSNYNPKSSFVAPDNGKQTEGFFWTPLG